SPAAGGTLAASWSAALLAAGAVAKGGDGGGKEARRGRALRWCGGVGMAAAYVAVLVVAPRLAGGAVSGVASRAAGAGAGLVITSGFADFVMGAPYAALLVAVAAVEALLKGSELGAAGKGWLKAAEGALLALTFYLLFGGGTTPVDLYFGTVAADFSVGLLLPLVLLEIAAGSRLAQGVVEAGVFSGSGRKGEDGARQKQVDAENKWTPRSGIHDRRVPGISKERRRYFPVILNRVVPHEAHLPLRAWRPFLKVTVLAATISLDFFSFTQKALVMNKQAPLRDISGQVILVAPS
ncbi:MAG: hypothetical protein JRM82_00815, partial [Nitrososphaerota archaeon]|nr:hypothetical protein [Nitrososphaerota archaeon]